MPGRAGTGSWLSPGAPPEPPANSPSAAGSLSSRRDNLQRPPPHLGLLARKHCEPEGTTPPAAPATAPAHTANPVPQGNGGDQDADNNGGPADGDGNL